MFIQRAQEAAFLVSGWGFFSSRLKFALGLYCEEASCCSASDLQSTPEQGWLVELRMVMSALILCQLLISLLITHCLHKLGVTEVCRMQALQNLTGFLNFWGLFWCFCALLPILK